MTHNSKLTLPANVNNILGKVDEVHKITLCPDSEIIQSYSDLSSQVRSLTNLLQDTAVKAAPSSESAIRDHEQAIQAISVKLDNILEIETSVSQTLSSVNSYMTEKDLAQGDATPSMVPNTPSPHVTK